MAGSIPFDISLNQPGSETVAAMPEADGFLSRYDYKEIPPHVEYHLTDLGRSFISVFEQMKQWGDENLSEET